MNKTFYHNYEVVIYFDDGKTGEITYMTFDNCRINYVINSLGLITKLYRNYNQVIRRIEIKEV